MTPVQHSDEDQPDPQRRTTVNSQLAELSERHRNLEQLTFHRLEEQQASIDQLVKQQDDILRLLEKMDNRAEERDRKSSDLPEPMPESSGLGRLSPKMDSTPRHGAPKRQLQMLDFHPEEHPSRFRLWISRLLQFQQHYKMPNSEAIAELQWYGGDILDERLRLVLTARPAATLSDVCQQLIQAALPAGAAQIARRAFHNCRQLENESASSFIRRFQTATAEFRRFDNPSEQDLYNAFLSQLNTQYFGELRTDIAESGYLQKIEQPATRLLAVFGAVRQIEASKGITKETVEELSVNKQAPSTDPAARRKALVTNIGNQHTATSPVCRTCQRAARDPSHDYKKCHHALQRIRCSNCKNRGHFGNNCPEKQTTQRLPINAATIQLAGEAARP